MNLFKSLILGFLFLTWNVSAASITPEERLIAILSAGIQSGSINKDDLDKIYKDLFHTSISNTARGVVIDTSTLSKPLLGSVYTGAIDKVFDHFPINLLELKTRFDAMSTERQREISSKIECVDKTKIVDRALEFSLVDPSPFQAERLVRSNDHVVNQTISIHLSHRFEISQTAITVGMWKEVLGDIPDRYYEQSPDTPIRGVDLLSKMVFLNELSKKNGLPEVYSYVAYTKYIGLHSPYGRASNASEILEVASKGNAWTDILAKNQVSLSTVRVSRTIEREILFQAPPFSLYQESGYRLMTRFEAAMLAEQARVYLNSFYKTNRTEGWPDTISDFVPFALFPGGFLMEVARRKPILLGEGRQPIYDFLDGYPITLHELSAPIDEEESPSSWSGEYWREGKLHHYGKRHLYMPEQLGADSASLSFHFPFSEHHQLGKEVIKNTILDINSKYDESQMGAFGQHSNKDQVFYAVRTIDPEKIPEQILAKKPPDGFFKSVRKWLRW